MGTQLHLCPKSMRSLTEPQATLKRKLEEIRQLRRTLLEMEERIELELDRIARSDPGGIK